MASKKFPRPGLGCVTFGREINEEDAFRLMDHAITNGIDHFDTAAAYGNGRSERIIGLWLSRRRAPVSVPFIATKVLPPYHPENILASVEGSLERLGRTTIDILYLHRWDQTCESVPGLAAIDGIMRSGKVREIGVSNFSAGQLQHVLRLQEEHGFLPFRHLQNNHNLAVREITEELKSLCSASDIRLEAYSPLGAGFLTGKHKQGVSAGSRFDLMPAHQDIYFNELAYKRLARLEQVASCTGFSPAHLALAWIFHQPGIDSVLIGGRTLAHLDQAFAAMSFNDPDIFAELESV